MSSSSPFQFLPPHVVRLIVDHVVGSSRVVFARIKPNSNEWNIAEAAALDLGPGTASFNIGHHMNNNLGYPTHHLAKPLDIEIDEESIYSGEALKMLSRVPYDGCAFPLVRRIVFLLVTDDGLKESKKTKRNIVPFVRRIKQMAPNVNDIWVRPMDYDAPRASTSLSYGNLVVRLFQLAVRVQYGDVCAPMTSVSLLPYDFRNIVHIKCITGAYDQSFIELAHQISATLESLIIRSERAINIPSIIRKEGGDFVTYPHLHTLKLNGYSGQRGYTGEFGVAFE
ncbi:hypothetical protein H4R27_000428 [Coemansia aciculifera]|nr:hypothetical protein H4R27_000428 [Coemansia aciculifera]